MRFSSIQNEDDASKKDTVSDTPNASTAVTTEGEEAPAAKKQDVLDDGKETDSSLTNEATTKSEAVDEDSSKRDFGWGGGGYGGHGGHGGGYGGYGGHEQMDHGHHEHGHDHHDHG